MKTLIKQSKVSIFNSNHHKSLPKSSNQTQIQKNNNIQSKASVIINYHQHLIHKTTKQSHNTITTKMRLLSSGISQCHNSVLRNNKNIMHITTSDCIHVKKINSKSKGIQYNNNNTSSSINKIPIKVSRFLTTTVTTKHSRKSSNDKKQNCREYHHPKLVMSQSSSATKIKSLLKPNNKDFKILLSKFSVISHLASISKGKKNDSFSNVRNGNGNLHYSSHDSHHTVLNAHNNSLLAHNNTQGNIELKSYDKPTMIITTTINNNNNNNINHKQYNNNHHHCHLQYDNIVDDKKASNNTMNNHNNSINNNNHHQLNQTNNIKKTHNTHTNTTINTHNNKQQIHHRNQKIQSAFKSLKSITNSFHSNIPNHHNHDYKRKTQISTESCQPSQKMSNASIIHLNQMKKLNDHKSAKESILQKYTYQSLLYTNSQNNQHHLNIDTSNHSPYKSTTTNGLHQDNNGSCSTTSLQLSGYHEANYFKTESRKLAEYIKQCYNNNGGQYPKANLHFYKIGRAIGHGAFGKVNIALHILTGRIVAIKSFNKEKSMYYKTIIDNEIKLMKKLRPHKNIVKVFERIDTEKYDCFIMENISGGNLLSLIHKRTILTEETAKFIFRQIIETLKYVHSQGIVHRDIKPDNILIDLNNTIKLCDFGIGREVRPGQLLNDICGTPAFVAPEILCDSHYDPFPTDIWSSGVVLYSMLSGVFPFKGNNEHELHKSIMSGTFHDLPNDISSECKQLINGILEINPDLRMTIEDIQNHPWMMTSKNKEISITPLFSNAEKIIYSKLNIDYRNEDKKEEMLIELFTYRNMDTSQENENQNVISKSFIVTPYNSNIKNRIYNNSNHNNIDDKNSIDDDIEIYYEDLFIENEIMKFGPKVNEFNRNYEINYNAEADQGFMIYHKKKRKLKRQLSSVHIIESDVINKKQNSCRKKDIQKRNDTNNNCKDSLSTNNTNTFCIEDNIVKILEEFGYKRDYVIKALENNELNHSTGTYYLLINSPID